MARPKTSTEDKVLTYFMTAPLGDAQRVLATSRTLLKARTTVTPIKKKKLFTQTDDIGYLSAGQEVI